MTSCEGMVDLSSRKAGTHKRQEGMDCREVLGHK